MRTLRSNILQLFSLVGIVATMFTLFMLTGFLTGILTPDQISAIFASAGSEIMAAKRAWWLGIASGWLAIIWMTWFLVRTRSHPPISIKADEKGAVEVTTDALCTLARREAQSQGIKGPCRAEFTRKLGSPILQLFCDLTPDDNKIGPVIWGETLRKKIEDRLESDFNLNGIKVCVIHQPRSKVTRRSKPQPVSR